MHYKIIRTLAAAANLLQSAIKKQQLRFWFVIHLANKQDCERRDAKVVAFTISVKPELFVDLMQQQHSIVLKKPVYNKKCRIELSASCLLTAETVQICSYNR